MYEFSLINPKREAWSLMNIKLSGGRQAPVSSIGVAQAASLIARTQRPDGEIPWCEGQKTDPWDHVESAMGLSVGGYLAESQRAFEWLAAKQLDDGSWYTAYRQGVAEDKTRDANLSCYLAVGIFHYYLITEDEAFLMQMWPTLLKAIEFALSLQTPNGEIHWAISPEGNVDHMALLTGSSSI